MRPLGIELDAAACATRAAAGHETIQADVAAFQVTDVRRRARNHRLGALQVLSAAGTGIGRLVLDILAAAIPRHARRRGLP